MMDLGIVGCTPVPVRANADGRGCLFEIFREAWPGAFHAVQWNACASRAGVMRGVHVHVDYDEFYTLPMGSVFLALKDVRRPSPTFARCAAFTWNSADGFAVPVPAGVAHAVYFLEDSVLALGLSSYWQAQRDVVGCRWDELDPSIRWPVASAELSLRDAGSGTFDDMLRGYEEMLEGIAVAAAAPPGVACAAPSRSRRGPASGDA